VRLSFARLAGSVVGCAFALIAQACGSSSNTGPQTGTINGMVLDSAFGGIAGVSVVVTTSGGQALPSTTTDASGNYSVTSVPSGAGSVAVSDLPSGCVAPAPTKYTGLAGGGAEVVNVPIACPSATGTVSGTVINSLGVAVANAHVVVTPTGGSALPAVTTAADGSYSVSSVPVGSGSVAVSGVGPSCHTAPIAYTKLTPHGYASANITAVCPESAALFLLNSSGGVYGFPGTLLTSSGSTLPASVAIGGGAASAMAFDATGNLWIATEPSGSAAGAITEYTPSQVDSGSTTGTVVVTIQPGFMNLISSMAFDSHGTLWIAGNDVGNENAGLYGYSASQLTASGTPAPAYLIDDPGFYAARGIAFDQAGNLWLATTGEAYGTPLAIVEFTPAQLATANGNVTPVDSLLGFSVIGTEAQAQLAIAFDPNGNLWLTTDIDSVVAISKASLDQLGTNRSPAPFVTLQTSTPPTLGTSLAFDGAGNLWVLSVSDGTSTIYGTPPTTLERFSAATLTTSGTPPDITINLNGVPSSFEGEVAIAFAPGDANLPALAAARRRYWTKRVVSTGKSR
jgi:sugar lactone lactonase YvrE